MDGVSRRWWVPPVLLVMGAGGGAAVGLLTNQINVLVSPRYFAAVLGIDETYAWWAATVHGIVEGGILGALFGVVVSISFAASTGFRGRFSLAARTWGLAVLWTVGCWALGGCCGWFLGHMMPGTFQQVIQGVPSDGWKVARFAWVGGSIWGGYGGTVVAVILACVYQHRRWREEEDRRESMGFPVVMADRVVTERPIR